MGKLIRKDTITFALLFIFFIWHGVSSIVYLLLILIGTWYFYFRHPEKRKQFNSYTDGLPDLLNRTPLILGLGVIAIVIAIIYSGNQNTNNQLKIKEYEQCMESNRFYGPNESAECKLDVGLQ